MRPYKQLFSILLLSAFCSTSFAMMINSDLIKFIHTKTKSSFYTMCKDKMVGATDGICNCLSDNTVSYIDDTSLMKCNTTDNACITKVIATAGFRAFSKEGVKACIAKANSVAPQPQANAS